MKSTNKIAVTSVLAIAALGLTSGTANAATANVPAPPANTTISTDVLPGVHYTANAADHSVVISTGAGSLTTLGSQFQLQDGAGKVIAGTPLTTPQHTGALPNAAQAAAPVKTAAAPVAAQAQTSPLHNVDATDDFNSALSVAATQFGLATGVGTLAGGVIGAGIGCPLGAVTGGLVAAPTVVGSPILAGLGCLVGAGTGAGLGGLAGSALLGVPVGIASGVQMYNTLHAKGEA